MAGAAKLRKAALGFRTHSGWACTILATGRGREIAILERRRIGLCDPAKESAKQPFHAAEPMPFAQAESHIALCRKTAIDFARHAIIATQTSCKRHGFHLSGVCVITASGRALPDLRTILASHALIHAAEGEFYRDAVVEAALALDLAAARLKATDALAKMAERVGLGEAELGKMLVGLGKIAGRPWTADEKLATLAAWSLLPG
jgi:hypothetical protein